MNDFLYFLKKYSNPITNIGFFQIINLLTPFIILPLQIKHIDSEGLSNVFYFQAIFTFIGVFVAFGLNQNGTRLLAKMTNRHEQLNLLFQVSIIKLIIFSISLVLIIFFVLMLKTTDKLILFVLCSWPILVDIIIPEWYYQGIKKTKILFQKTTKIKVILILGNIFLLPLYNYPSLIPIFNISGLLFVLCTSIKQQYIVHIKRNIKEFFQTKSLINNLKDSFYFFSVNLSSKIYLSSGKLVIGIFTAGNEIIVYEVLEKLLNLLKIPNTIINQVFFVYSNEKKSLVDILYKRNLFYLGIFGNLLGVVSIYLVGEMIFNYLTSNNYNHGGILNIISFIPIVIFFGQYNGLHSLVAKGYLKQFSKCINLGVAFYAIIIIIGIISENISINFIYYLMLLTEVLITISIIYTNKKYAI